VLRVPAENVSVPPDLARDGLTGEVVATRFLDKLQAMQTATTSERPAGSYQYNWGSDIKVEIPETGVSLREFSKLLRDRFGHSNHITGVVIRTPTGIAVTARFGDATPATFTGPESDGLLVATWSSAPVKVGTAAHVCAVPAAAETYPRSSLITIEQDVITCYNAP
jgi:hypothetical protein